MFTQFFGNFLLNSGYLSVHQLSEVLSYNICSRAKLGVLALNAGYMTAEQVEEVHNMQAHVDKKFGTIANELGYLTDMQVLKLVNSQQSGYLLISQAVVDMGYMTLDQIQIALEQYRKEYNIDNVTLSDFQSGKLIKILQESFITNKVSDTKNYVEYIMLLFKDIVRFIGNDFVPLNSQSDVIEKSKYMACQNIEGEFSLFTAIEGDEQAFIKLASRFNQKQYEKMDEYVKSSVGEFLNQNNGLFTVNMSNSARMELDLTAPIVDYDVDLSCLKNIIRIPIQFSFGLANIILADFNEQIGK